METVTPPADLDLSHSGRRIGLRKSPRRATGCGSLLGAIAVSALAYVGACSKPTLVVGDYQCLESDADGGASSTDPITVPWETGFENGPCDYYKVGGFCYRFPPINFRLVDRPVHRGQYAAEITAVTRTDGGDQPQARCVRQGVLPVEAYYGAWYLVPKATTVLPTTAGDPGLWNLFHFGGGNTPTWDVSLVNGPTGDLNLHLYQFSPGTAQGDSPPIPIGRWFHVVLYLKRAKDTTGAVALYLDDEKVVEFTDLVTDSTDSDQWYVGNLASATDPPDCTVYLDDITIRSTL